MSVWPPGFARIPDEEWTRAPVASLAEKYDAVGKHGWYANLDPSVAELASVLREGDLLVDYSGGTGLLIERLLAAVGPRRVGVVDVDSSPKFLALSLEKLASDERVAFRLIRYLKEERRLQLLDEALAGPLATRGVDALVSANAIHLYYALDETLASWARVLRRGGHVHVQSGNVLNPDAPRDAWIIDDTVERMQPVARRLVAEDPRYARHRPVLEDRARMVRHDAFRAKVFLPPRPLAHYTDALERAGLRVTQVRARPVPARADEWHEFLAAYSDAVLGWVGGSEKVEGRAASPADVADRLAIMRAALDEMLGGREAFAAVWTYISARKDERAP